jgi:hypothetical protein
LKEINDMVTEDTEKSENDRIWYCVDMLTDATAKREVTYSRFDIWMLGDYDSQSKEISHLQVHSPSMSVKKVKNKKVGEKKRGEGGLERRGGGGEE